MTVPTNENLNPEERRLIEEIDRTFAPEPRSPAQRLLFREAIEARLTPQPWFVRQWRPALAATVALALLTLVLSTDRGLPNAQIDQDAAADYGDSGAFITLALGESEHDDFGDLLPEDFAVIAELLEF